MPRFTSQPGVPAMANSSADPERNHCQARGRARVNRPSTSPPRPASPLLSRRRAGGATSRLCRATYIDVTTLGHRDRNGSFSRLSSGSGRPLEWTGQRNENHSPTRQVAWTNTFATDSDRIGGFSPAGCPQGAAQNGPNKNHSPMHQVVWKSAVVASHVRSRVPSQLMILVPS